LPLTTSTHGPYESGYTRATKYDLNNNVVLSAYSWLEFACLQLELLVIAGYHTAVNPNLETVQTARQIGIIWLFIILNGSLFLCLMLFRTLFYMSRLSDPS